MKFYLQNYPPRQEPQVKRKQECRFLDHVKKLEMDCYACG